MRKLILLFAVTILCGSVHLNAQSFNDKFFVSRGLFLIYENGPSTLSPVYERESSSFPWKESGTYKADNYVGAGLGYQFSFRYNLYEIDDEMSVSASLPIGIGITSWSSTEYSSDGFGSLHIPLFVEFNYGNGATYSSSSNVGFVLGVGYQWDLMAVISDDVVDGYTSDKEKYDYPQAEKSWFHPTVKLGVRYWSRNNKLREINIRYGFGSKEEWEDSNGASNSHSPLSLQISFLRTMNY